MRDVDTEIAEALGRDEREILDRIGEEPGFFGMSLNLFSGRLGWVNMILMVTQAILFLAGVYAAWMFFEAATVDGQLRWGLPAAVLLIVATMIKMAMWPTIHADRLMREMKRIQLVLAQGNQRSRQ